MKFLINNDEYIVIFEEKNIDNLSFLIKKLKEVPVSTKKIIFNLNEVKYVSSLFIDYLAKLNSIAGEKNITLGLLNCPENVNALLKKSYKNLQIEIHLKDT